MRLTRGSSYALHAVAYLAGQEQNGLTASHVIAQKRGIPERFLLKVLKPLVSAQILDSVKGPSGGYKLARRVNSISLLNVLEAVDGPIRGCAPPGKGEKDTALAKRLDHIFCHCAEECRKNLDRIKISELVGIG